MLFAVVGDGEVGLDVFKVFYARFEGFKYLGVTCVQCVYVDVCVVGRGLAGDAF